MSEIRLQSPTNDDDSGEMKLLKAELDNISLPEGTTAVFMNSRTLESVDLVPPILLMPGDLMAELIDVKSAHFQELISIYMPKIIEHLRSQKSSLLLAYSLLSLSRAWGGYNPLEARTTLILEAITIFKQIKVGGSLGRAYLDLAIIFKEAQHFYDALYILDLAEKESESDEDAGALSAAWYHKATICRFLGQNIEALYFLNRAEKALQDNFHYQNWLVKILYERIPNKISLERFGDAVIDANRLVNDYAPHFMAHFYLGELYRLNGKEALALQSYLKSAALLSEDVLNNQTGHFQVIDRARHDFVYKNGLRTAINLNDPLAAFSLLQLSKTEGLQLLLSPGRASTTRSPLSENDQSAIKEIRESALSAFRCNDGLLLDDAQLRADWLIADRDFRVHRRSEDIDLMEIAAKIQSAIPAAALLLEFFFLEKEFWVIMITTETLVLKRSDLLAPDIEMLAASFAQEIKANFPTDSIQVMAEGLLGPFSDYLARKDTLIIAQHEFLNGIPFHAMAVNGKTLIETHAVRYVASFFPLLLQETDSKNETTVNGCRFLGTPVISYASAPPLPGVLDEARIFERHLPHSKLIVDPPASSQDLLEAQPIDLLHIACHGEFDPKRPLLSRLLMADRPVFAFELICYGIKADHVVITACRTAESSVQPGGYTNSIASAFLKGGAKEIVAAFWPIDDEAGALFSDLFYSEYLNIGSISGAMRSAQLRLRDQPEFAHPYFWAPFAIFGLDYKS